MASTCFLQDDLGHWLDQCFGFLGVAERQRFGPLDPLNLGQFH